ncbi:MAG: CDP-alcohol phosphatidyltransferase family protein [Clostridia bacterium]|nr:CDP-alcohol phosphatidyltransferase family protein [Clostridia bacterium]
MSNKAGKAPLNLADLITLSRIIAALGLLLLPPFGIAFQCCYAFCGVSDVLDGFVARRLKVAGERGAKLDGAADTVFFLIILALSIRYLEIPTWAWGLAGAVLLIKVAGGVAGLIKFRALPFLHTHLNKAAGVAVFLFLPLYRLAGAAGALIPVLLVALLAATEELLLVLRAGELNREQAGIFRIKP